MSLEGTLLRAASAALVGVAAWLVRHDGGGADAYVPPPHASAPAAGEGTGGGGHGPTGYEVAVRLRDRLGEARLEVPSLRAGEALLASHWRKMQTPWLTLSGDAARLAVSIALAHDEEEAPREVPLADGTVWVPDVHEWNMAEGSFDQREAIFAPTPATLSFRVTVPLGGRLSFSTAVASPSGAGTRFAVKVIGPSGEAREVFARTAPKEKEPSWADGSVDLSDLGGQPVELRFETRAADRPNPPVGLALWGNPVLLGKEPTRVPYNVLWIVVDALRPDVIASFHDDAEDAAKASAPHPPLEAQLPRVEGLTPSIDALAARGVRFAHAWSAATWTRPGTLALLTGERSGQLGVDTTVWPLEDSVVARYYASDPPLVSLLLRHEGVETRAFVNNYFMVGYAQIGVDMGFERVDDQRYRTRDTAEITDRATGWLRSHADDRFFLFVNYNSPHSPWDPPGRFLDRIPPPPAGPAADVPRLYMGEGAKDDEAIGTLTKTLDELALRDRTLVIVTSDHGETLSDAHRGTLLLDHTPVQYHHTASDYEETTRIPILMSLPGVLPEGAVVKAHVRSTDVAPTVLELEGLDPSPKSSGKSLLALARGGKEADERVVVSEGRSMKGILLGSWHYVQRDGKAQTVTQRDGTDVNLPEELFDLAADPGERFNLARSRADKAAEMRARLEAALAGAPVAGSLDAQAASQGKAERPKIALRFAGGGETHRVSGSIVVGDGKSATVDVEPVGLGADAMRTQGGHVDIAFRTAKDAVVGFDLRVDPPSAPVQWSLYLDDQPWPVDAVFGGPFGLAAPSLRSGLSTDDAREAARAPRAPMIDPVRDEGLFVASERRPEAHAPVRPGEGTDEMNRLLHDWGYARASSGKKK